MKSLLHKRRFWLPIALLVTVVPLSAEPVATEKVRVSVVAICAHNRDNEVDPRLKSIAEEIQKAVPQLTGFKIGKMTCKSLAVGVPETFELVDKQVAVLTVVQAGGKGTPMQIKLTPPMMGEVTYETSCTHFLPIITKYRTEGKEVLILAVRVLPCPKKP